MIFSSPTWNLPRAYEVTSYLGCVKLHTLDIGYTVEVQVHSSCTPCLIGPLCTHCRLKFACVAYMAFVGAQKALERQFADVASALFRTTKCEFSLFSLLMYCHWSIFLAFGG